MEVANLRELLKIMMKKRLRGLYLLILIPHLKLKALEGSLRKNLKISLLKKLMKKAKYFN
ncbi:MAG: hypothetical protein ACFE8E_09975 [Candidatus Hodarchaeota archaeon]